MLAHSVLGPHDTKALHALDDLMADPHLVLRFDMNVGDALFANNRITLHRRTEFIDAVNVQGKRLLYRMWIQRER